LFNFKQVLYHGWTPVLVAMTISSAGGLILDNAVAKFKGIAVFQPVFNGVGGNLVSMLYFFFFIVNQNVK
jgi:solute carrier family 41